MVLPTGAGKTHVAVMAIDAEAAQHARRRADARSRAPVVRPAARDVSASRSASSAAASTTCSRSPSPRTTRRTCTWSTSARASGSSCSTSAITCPSPTYALAARSASRRIGSASRRRPSAPTDATPMLDDARRAHRLPTRHRRARGRVPRRVRDRARRRRARPRGARRVRRRARASTSPSSRRTGSAWRARAAGASSSMRSSRERRGPRARCAPTAGSASSPSPPARSSTYLEHLLHEHRARSRARLHAGQRHGVRASRVASSSRCITHQTKVRERSEILDGFSRTATTARS